MEGSDYEVSLILYWMALLYGHKLCRKYFGFNIFIHISIYSNIQIYILQYNHDGIQKKENTLIPNLMERQTNIYVHEQNYMHVHEYL